VKPLVVGHWGTTPGQTFIYVHLNRVITAYDLDMIHVADPGHGGPALVRNTYLEGSYSDRPPPARHPATIAFTIHMPVGGVPSGAVARAVP